jgi:hypothetical protein
MNLHRASMANQRQALKLAVVGQTIAVTHALDLAFNQGKGQIMEKWLTGLDGQKIEPKKRPAANQSAMAFFMSLPQRQKETPNG